MSKMRRVLTAELAKGVLGLLGLGGCLSTPVVAQSVHPPVTYGAWGSFSDGTNIGADACTAPPNESTEPLFDADNGLSWDPGVMIFTYNDFAAGSADAFTGLAARVKRSVNRRTITGSTGPLAAVTTGGPPSIVGHLTPGSLAPSNANTNLILDTGTPAGNSSVLLNSAQWLAGEFAVTAGTDISTLSAYLTQGVGEPGDSFTFDIYSSNGFTGRSSGRILDYSATGTFTANGWNTTSVNWTPTSTGDYWLALQVSSPAQSPGFDAPVEASASTGTVPALAFAVAGTNGQYTTTGAPPIGLEITSAAVSPPTDGPMPLWALGGLGAGLVAIASRRINKKAA